MRCVRLPWCAGFLTRRPPLARSPLQVNTERTIHKPTGIRHVEGGWPENVDSSEIDQVDRFLKKAVKVRARAQALFHLHAHTLRHIRLSGGRGGGCAQKRRDYK